MIVTDESEVDADSASALGLTLLGQLVRHLSEARYVLRFLAGEVHLSLDELSSALDLATGEAAQAFEAASLLLSGAALDASWSRRASRPAAVFARHNAAVRGGATLVEPATVPMLIHSERSPVSDDDLPPKPAGATRPLCGYPTKTTGKPCQNLVVVLEDGVLASGCAVAGHLPDAERPSYERQKAQTAAWYEAVGDYQRSNVDRMMTETAALWLRRQAREFAIRWDDFCRDVGIADPLTAQTPEQHAEDAEATSPCEGCEPLFVDETAHASVAMHLLHGWAAQQPLPAWADRTLRPGDWLFEVPRREQAHPHDLSLHLAATLLAAIATPPGSFAEAVDARHHELINTMLGQFAYAQSVLPPEGIPPTTPASPPQSAGSPAPRRQAKKKRKKR